MSPFVEPLKDEEFDQEGKRLAGLVNNAPNPQTPTSNPIEEELPVNTDNLVEDENIIDTQEEDSEVRE